MTGYQMTDYTLSGRLRAPQNFDQLKTEINRLKKAKGNLYREFGYMAGCNPDQLGIAELCDICEDLKTFYKRSKNHISKQENKKNKKLWKKTKKCVKAVANSASRVIQFCLKQIGKKNLESMQQATRIPPSLGQRGNHGWSSHRISNAYERETELFENTFNSNESQSYDSDNQLSIPYKMR